MRRRRAVPGMLAVATAALLTVGCGTAPPLPEGLPVSTVEALIDRGSRDRWESFAPDVPYPVVQPIRSVSRDELSSVREMCLADAKPEDDDGLTYQEANSSRALEDIFICDLQYPLAVDDPAALGYLSAAQADYLEEYYQSRVIPCIRLLGYHVRAERPLSDDEVHYWWQPYTQMSPQPESRDEWLEIERRCPPSVLGSEIGLPSEWFVSEP